MCARGEASVNGAKAWHKAILQILYYGQIARKKEIGKIMQAAICVPWGSGCYAAEPRSRSMGVSL